MTEKRYFVSGYSVWDSYNDNRRIDTRSKPICDLLNQLNNENEQLKEALKNKYWNEICENCKYGKYGMNWYGECEFECLKKHFGNDDWKCDGLKECGDFELDLKRVLDD